MADRATFNWTERQKAATAKKRSGSQKAKKPTKKKDTADTHDD